jgi:Holliday junction resolvasome RuvABC endonuclease subunit
MIIIGFDPGVLNFGIGVIRLNVDNPYMPSYKMVDYAQTESTLRNLTNKTQIKKPNQAEKKRIKSKKIKRIDLPNYPPIVPSLIKFYEKISEIFDLYEPDVVCIERFMSRGLGGTLIESVSMMIAVICLICLHRNIQIYTCVASEWKNEVNRHIDLEQVYNYAKSIGLSNHEIDGSMIALVIGLKHTSATGSTEIGPLLLNYKKKVNTWVKTKAT